MAPLAHPALESEARTARFDGLFSDAHDAAVLSLTFSRTFVACRTDTPDCLSPVSRPVTFVKVLSHGPASPRDCLSPSGNCQ
jgi:hypothetical protein